MERKVKYNEIEDILGDKLVVFKGKCYTTKENMQFFPAYITLVDEGTSVENLKNVIRDIIKSLKIEESEEDG